LLDYHNQILKNVTSEMSVLKKLGQIDISVSPLQHPILPLLCDSTSAREAMPYTPLPEPTFKYPEDAKKQIERGIDLYKKYFDEKPSGM
jgi:alpha-amylase/alpha-mannosidase (GH57 family)